MSFAAVRLVSVNLGAVQPLGPQAVPSGFVKRAVDGPVAVGPLGLAGDAQADLSVHGGPEKAVYGYGLPAYDGWRADHPQHSWGPGAVGENLSFETLTEESVCIGDVFAIGSARLQVCQPRQPCFKFALRFADPGMPRAMVKNGRCGWYFRVLEPGAVEAGDTATILDRPNPDWPVLRLFRIITGKAVERAELDAMATLDGLASQWRRSAGGLL